MSGTRSRSAWFLSDHASRAPREGTIGYDASCTFCTSTARKLFPFLAPRGYDFAPLQSSRVADAAGFDPAEIPEEIVLVTAGGEVYSGAEAIAQVARGIWWASPFWAATRIPPLAAAAQAAYRAVSARRHCLGGGCRVRRERSRRGGWIVAGLLLVLFVALAVTRSVVAGDP